MAAVAKGSDVYLFLTGMMLLSEVARREGLFDRVAATAVDCAKGSTARLFALIYAAGIIVTTFLSNDATAVVLTPAVYAAAKKGRADPLPVLFACALVANAASFVLPISNPANLVLYGGHMPPLGAWLRSFALPSLASIVVTFAALRLVERKRLAGDCARDVARASRYRVAAGRRWQGSSRPQCCSSSCRRSIGRSDCRRASPACSPLGPCPSWRAARQARSSPRFPGPCCRWLRGCSCWSRRSTARGS